MNNILFEYPKGLKVIVFGREDLEKMYSPTLSCLARFEAGCDDETNTLTFQNNRWVTKLGTMLNNKSVEESQDDNEDEESEDEDSETDDDEEERNEKKENPKKKLKREVDLRGMKVVELRKLLRDKGLPVSGIKRILIERLTKSN